MRRLLLSIILICLLTVPASAHPGGTDSSGGHYDHDTGEYHYHHGYDAHDHYDMDGDGDTDCPYDFDDQTGRNSGSPSSTSSQVDDNAYDRGHRAGYDEGYEDGRTNGLNYAETKYDNGYEDGLAEGYEKGRADTKPIILGSIALSAVAAAIFVFICCRKDHKRRMAFAESSHASELREMDRELRAIKTERDKLLAQQEAVRTGCQARIDQVTADCRKRIQETTDLCNAKVTRIESVARQKITESNQRHNADLADQHRLLEETRQMYADNLQHWESVARETRLRKFLAHFPADNIELSDIPENAELCGGSVSIGNTSSQYPFGLLTVYTASSGKCYHRKRGCCGAFMPRNHYDMLLQSVPSCSKCCSWNDYAAIVPDWYIRYKEVISGQAKM